jgi:hypothetical protein
VHLRLRKDGSGILIVNASTVLHLNPSAAEYAFHFIKGTNPDEAAKQVAAGCEGRGAHSPSSAAGARESRTHQPVAESSGSSCPASVAVGLFSLAYHASYTWFLQFFDFVGMFLFTFLVLALNARRLGWIRPARVPHVYLSGVAVFTALVPPLFHASVPIQGLVLLLILAGIGQEAALRRRDGPHPARRAFAAALALLGAAAVCSFLDVTRVWCDPADHVFQGHAAWHLLSAASLYALFRFYAALELPRA